MLFPSRKVTSSPETLDISSRVPLTAELAETAEKPNTRGAITWPLFARIGFRFCFVYFGLYVLTTQFHWIQEYPVNR